MTTLEKTKLDIISILETSCKILFTTRWVTEHLNKLRKEEGMFGLRDFVVDAVLLSMVHDGTLEQYDDEWYSLADLNDENQPDDEETDEVENQVQVNVYNFEFNVTINNTDNSVNISRRKK
jgi:hypothetical protein